MSRKILIAVMLGGLLAPVASHAELVTLGARTPSDVDGHNVVGGYNGFAFLYNDLTQIVTTLPISGGASGISGQTLVGNWGNDGWIYNLATTGYEALNNPLGVKTQLTDIDGDNVVGNYVDSAGKQHGFLYDIGSETWTTLDYPGGASSFSVNGISGNTIVGQYIDSSGSHGFLYDGATWTTLNATSGNGFTSIRGISGSKLVGIFGADTLYDLSTETFSNPLIGVNFPPGQIVQSVTLNGISGNTVVGTYNYWNGHNFVNAGLVYIGVPETSSLTLLLLGGGGMPGAALLRRSRNRSSLR